MKDIASMTLLEIARHYHGLAAAYNRSEGGVAETRALNEFEDALRKYDQLAQAGFGNSEAGFTATVKISSGEDALGPTHCLVHGTMLTATGICTICQANRE